MLILGESKRCVPSPKGLLANPQPQRDPLIPRKWGFIPLTTRTGPRSPLVRYPRLSSPIVTSQQGDYLAE